MTQTKEKWISLFWAELTFEWYEAAMAFRVFIFIFLFRTNGKTEHLDENNFCHCYGNFFESAAWKVSYLIKVPGKQSVADTIQVCTSKNIAPK